jgi:hypothetical protein
MNIDGVDAYCLHLDLAGTSQKLINVRVLGSFSKH